MHPINRGHGEYHGLDGDIREKLEQAKVSPMGGLFRFQINSGEVVGYLKKHASHAYTPDSIAEYASKCIVGGATGKISGSKIWLGSSFKLTNAKSDDLQGVLQPKGRAQGSGSLER